MSHYEMFENVIVIKLATIHISLGYAHLILSINSLVISLKWRAIYSK